MPLLTGAVTHELGWSRIIALAHPRLSLPAVQSCALISQSRAMIGHRAAAQQQRYKQAGLFSHAFVWTQARRRETCCTVGASFHHRSKLASCMSRSSALFWRVSFPRTCA